MGEPAPRRTEVPIERLEVSAYTVPTQTPESDGTLEWCSTTLVLVYVHAGAQCGLGFTYASAAAARLVSEQLAPVLHGLDAMDVPAAWGRMVRALRNVGAPGLGAMAVSAVDIALWDLKARLLGLPLVRLLGQVRPSTPAYGSGGFTSYSLHQLCAQLSAWVEQGLPRVKMKVGRDPHADVARVRAAREAIGEAAGLMVDANGAYARKQALGLARRFAASGVDWLEEPVPSDDLEGLRLLRDEGPAGVDVSAGEYASTQFDFVRLLHAGAVDVLQADATRCMGYSGVMRAAVLADSHGVALSLHTAPALHAQVACALEGILHVEYFFDHVRLEELLFDGTPRLSRGHLWPDASAPGHGLAFKHQDAREFAV